MCICVCVYDVCVYVCMSVYVCLLILTLILSLSQQILLTYMKLIATTRMHTHVAVPKNMAFYPMQGTTWFNLNIFFKVP